MPLVHTVVEEAVVAKPAETGVVCPNPKRPISIFVNAPDLSARGTFGQKVGNDFPGFEA